MFDDSCASSDHYIITNVNQMADTGSYPQPRLSSKLDGSGEITSRADMGKVAQYAIMVDSAPCIQDNAAPYVSAYVNNNASAYD